MNQKNPRGRCDNDKIVANKNKTTLNFSACQSRPQCCDEAGSFQTPWMFKKNCLQSRPLPGNF